MVLSRMTTRSGTTSNEVVSMIMQKQDWERRSLRDLWIIVQLYEERGLSDAPYLTRTCINRNSLQEGTFLSYSVSLEPYLIQCLLWSKIRVWLKAISVDMVVFCNLDQWAFLHSVVLGNFWWEVPPSRLQGESKENTSSERSAGQTPWSTTCVHE